MYICTEDYQDELRGCKAGLLFLMAGGRQGVIL